MPRPIHNRTAVDLMSIFCGGDGAGARHRHHTKNEAAGPKQTLQVSSFSLKGMQAQGVLKRSTCIDTWYSVRRR